MSDYTEKHPFAFPVRRDLVLHFDLPLDLTSSEVERIARWMRTLVIEAPAPPATSEPLPALPPGPASPTPVPPAQRGHYRVMWEMGGKFVDLWESGRAAEGTGPSDAEQVVREQLAPWALLAALDGQRMYVGELGGTLREGAAIVRASTRARTVIIGGRTVVAATARLSDGAQAATIEPQGAVGPLLTGLGAPVGEKVYRVAWACPQQELRLDGPPPELPARQLQLRLLPTAEETTIDLVWAIWVG